ncbi:hypothetical protein FOL47_008822, partial [Perkinsus chesapeaki]
YLIMLLSRSIMLIILWPFLTLIGPRIDWRSLVVISWGGLRGAVALSLAVMVTKSQAAFPNVRLREELMFIVGGCVCLTLLINATTAHALVNFLGFTKLTTSKRILLKNVDLSIAEAAREMYDELLVDEEVLRTSCPKSLTGAVSTLRNRVLCEALDDEEEYRKRASPRREIRRAYSDIRLGHRVISPDTRMMSHTDTRAHLEELAIQETVVSIRKTLLSAVKAEYWDFMNLGLLPRSSTAAQLLIYSVETAQQFHIEEKMNDWNKLKKRLESKRRASLWRLKQKMRLTTDFASSWAELTVYVVDSFVAAHIRAQKSIARYYGHTASADTAEEWLVIEESKHEVRDAKEYLHKALGSVGWRVVKLAHSKQLAQFILIHQKTIVETMEGQGVISEGDAEGILHKIQSDLEALTSLSLESVDSGCLEDSPTKKDSIANSSEGGSALAEESEDAFEGFPSADGENGEADNFLLNVIKSARICMLAHGEDLVDELEFLAKKDEQGSCDEESHSEGQESDGSVGKMQESQDEQDLPATQRSSEDEQESSHVAEEGNSEESGVVVTSEEQASDAESSSSIPSSPRYDFSSDEETSKVIVHDDDISDSERAVLEKHADAIVAAFSDEAMHEPAAQSKTKKMGRRAAELKALQASGTKPGILYFHNVPHEPDSAPHECQFWMNQPLQIQLEAWAKKWYPDLDENLPFTTSVEDPSPSGKDSPPSLLYIDAMKTPNEIASFGLQEPAVIHITFEH